MSPSTSSSSGPLLVRCPVCEANPGKGCRWKGRAVDPHWVRAALALICPDCGARPGHRCRTRGKPRKKLHISRTRLAGRKPKRRSNKKCKLPPGRTRTVATILEAQEPNPLRRADLRARLDDMSYSDYLLSDTWWIFRIGILKRDKQRCQHCGTTRDLQIHHHHYETLKNERPKDVITLCDTCHEKEEEWIEENGRRWIP